MKSSKTFATDKLCILLLNVFFHIFLFSLIHLNDTSSVVVPYCRRRCIDVLFTFSKTLYNFKVLLLERIPWLVVTYIWQQKHALLFMAA